MFAPAQTPAAVIGRLEKEIAWVLNDPETIKKVQAAGVEPMPGGTQALANLLKAEIERAGNVVRAAKIQPE